MTRPISSLAAITRLNVLVLEDQMFQRNLLVGVLKHLGIDSVVSASAGQEALDIIMSANAEFDVAICDLQMDGMDGIEFIRRAAGMKVQSFIVTSAIDANVLSSAETVVRGYNTRLLGVLPKPINVARLTQMLNQCISQLPFVERPDQELGSALLPNEPDLREAFTKRKIVPVFAPKISADTGAPTGADMSAHWVATSLGGVPSNALMTATEAFRLDDAYIDALYPTAMASTNAWTTAGHDIGVSLHLPASALLSPDFPTKMVEMAGGHCVVPGRITFEVSETAGFKNVSHFMAGLTRLRMHGFRTSLGDFGNGHR